MNMVLQIVVNTPPWVWVLLAFLLFLGIRALQPSTAPLWRIAILPTVFCVWGVSGLFSLHKPTPERVSSSSSARTVSASSAASRGST